MLSRKGDPKLALALFATRASGSLNISAAAILLTIVGISAPVMYDVDFVIMLSLFGGSLFLPGVVYIGLSFPLERRRKWAAITLLVIEGLQLPLLLLWLIRVLVSIWQQFLGTLAVSLILAVLLCTAGVLAIIFIARALPTLRLGGMQRRTGFEPIFKGGNQ